MLRDLPLKAVYRSETDSLLEDFYIPALSQAVTYDRAVGYFSAGMISYAAQGLSAFIGNEGKMRLVIGGELAAEDVDAMREGYETRKLSERYGDVISQALGEVSDGLFQRRLEALSYLIATGRLDVKLALKRRGMYHEKIGILRDRTGDGVVFQGSANETANALVPDFNFESVNVFKTWRTEYEEHFRPYIDGFERLWDNKARDTIVLDFPEAARDRLVRIASQARFPTPEIEIDLWRKHYRPTDNAPDFEAPRLPVTFGGAPFSIMDHQRSALQKWKAAGLSGVLALATGAGKTITSIYGAVRLFEQTQRLFLIVAVPYQNLADQWVDTLAEFNITPLRCYANAADWTDEMSRLVMLFETHALNFACIVVVNRTLQGERFQQMLAQIPGEHLMWVGDECHHHASPGLRAALPEQAKMRLGLSATPEHYLDPDVTERLLSYYGDIVDTYTLADALRDKVLTPYDYHVVLVDLTDDEVEEYRRLSDQLSKLMAQAGGKDPESSSDDRIKILLMKRARLLGAAANKMPALRKLLADQPPQKMSLFYCGDGRTEDEDSGLPMRQIELASQELHGLGWSNAQFTSRESRAARIEILDHFRLGLVDALVAIRCLDEGIDVPACRTAYILASSRNPKQFIQRRGRILRRAPSKEYARIYDFVVRIPDDSADDSPMERQLMINELKRVAEFARLARNSADALDALEPILERYDLHHHLV
ncbi:DNA-repair protein [Brevundimonas denitrificans]|uniref:DNA-repair protein n=1 Tax=Brevundimonas denitrificans TaxID=1443434 RepID=A0ABQ6BGI2_9CAUL|nr:DEAD/DEAH box helicase family protein [Brevundimonas denitrificans]GLS00436.1 DNA-repair protein [Brevundimonas denitrificans]